jgi:glycosyltransferase involved in cell wall biosynthesis
MTLVCIDCRYIGGNPSGIGEVTWGLVRNLPRLAPNLDFVFLRTTERCAPLSTAANVTEISVNAPANSPQTMWGLTHLVDLDKVDLFHAPFNILPAGLKMRTLTTIHDIMWLTNPDWCNPRLYGHIERRFYANGIGRALNRSDAIATVSSATRREILQRRPDLDEKVHVTLSGVSDNFKKAEVKAETLKAVGLDPKQKFVLTAGQCAPYKNHEGAIKAFAKAFKSREDISLVMVQRRNSGARTLHSLAKRLGINSRVHFTGKVGFATLLELYSGAIALLHPSFCEGFGNPLAEAMACGCPVITSNVSAMPEVTGDAALLVNPNDTFEIAAALTKVVTDKGLAARMRAKGLARAKELSWEQFAADNLAIYRELLARP